MKRDRFGIQAGMVAAAFWLAALAAEAADYKAWTGLLPEKLGGHARQGEAEGVNMEMGGQAWSSLAQEYGPEDGEARCTLTLMAGLLADQQQATFESLANFSMETAEAIVKTVTIDGHQALLQVDKEGGTSTVVVLLGASRVGVLTGQPIKTEAELMRLAQEVTWAKLAAAMK